jgi:pimeloyl-ACP methyl ester carboxylesterase
MTRWFACALLWIGSCLVAAAEHVVESGELGGSLYQIVKPAVWGGDVWVECHGLRPENTPLSAVVPVGSPFIRGLLEDGWLVATTSYRRNGMLLDEAAADVAALVGLIRERHRPQGVVVLEGSSMGGAVVVRLAESRPEVFDGAVACGAALQVREPTAPERYWTFLPRKPLIFLSNQSEFEGPAAYAAAVRAQASAAATEPVLLKVERDGHVNLNAAERRHALDLLVEWMRRGQRPEDGLATRPPAPGPSRAQLLDNRVRTQVVELSRIYGNLTLDAQPSDLAAIGVGPGGFFDLVAQAGRFRVLFGTSYADVARGEWVAFTTADGLLMVARNFASAAAQAGVETEGVSVELRPAASK